MLGYEPSFVPMPAPLFFWIGIALVAVLIIGVVWMFAMNHGFKEMSRQEIFDIVSSNLLMQGDKSLRESGGCAYRGKDGKKCAVGWLIPDEEYTPRMEYTSFSDEKIRPVLEKRIGRKLTHLDERLLMQLVECHDQGTPRFWHLDLERIAEKNGLRS